MSSTALLADEFLDEFYKNAKGQQPINPSSKKNKANVAKQSVKTMRLNPLRSSISEGNLKSSSDSGFSDPLVAENADASKNMKRYSFDNAQSPLAAQSPTQSSKLSHNTGNMHYLSNLQHRLAGVSGNSPLSSPSKSSPIGKGKSPGSKISQSPNLATVEEAFADTSSSAAALTDNDEEIQKNHAKIHRKLNAEVEQIQLKLLQDSSQISGIMQQIIEQYEAMKGILDNLIHRRELYDKVNTINEMYLSLFESMLQEIMKLQRNKFKSQSKLIEDFQKEHNVLYADYTIQTQSLQLVKDKYFKQEQEQASYEHQALILLKQLEEEKSRTKQVETEKHQCEIEIKRLTILLGEYSGHEPGQKKNKFIYEQEIKALEEANAKLKVQYQSLQHEHLNTVTEMKERNELLRQEIGQLKQQMKAMSVFQNLDKIHDFQHPKEDCSTQTEVNVWDGLWDCADGWVLPVRKTTAARIRWRRSLNFAKCSLCRGLGKSLLMVIKLIKQAQSGRLTSSESAAVDALGGSKSHHSKQKHHNPSIGHGNRVDVIGVLHEEFNSNEFLQEEKEIFFHDKENYFYYWKLLNELVLFIQSLPKSIVALNPKNTCLWVVKRSFVILHYKFLFDMQIDDETFAVKGKQQSKGVAKFQVLYHPQPLLTFVIEQYLRNSDNRHEAERSFYEYLLNLKEYYLHHPLLFYIARCFGLIDGLSANQQKLLKAELMQNRQALIKKKEKELLAMKAREKSKHQAKLKEEHDKLLGQPEFGIYYEDEFQITPFSLDEQILFYTLFFKSCSLQEPYTGIYFMQIKQIKERSGKLRNFAHDFQKVLDSFWFKTSESLQRFSDGERNISEESQKNLIPEHLFVDLQSNSFNFYIPLDRAIHVIHAIIEVEKITFPQQVSIYRKLEENTKFLSLEDGSIFAAEGMNSFIRSAMRLLLYSCRTGSPDGKDIATWDEVIACYQHPLNNPLDSVNESNGEMKRKDSDKVPLSSKLPSIASASASTKSAVKEKVEFDGNELSSPSKIQIPDGLHEHILMLNFDQFVIIVSEVLRQKALSIEKKLMKVFEKGDVNHDNVLSYDEFQDIINHVIPNYSYRKILQMFREALIEGEDGNNECIGPNSFLSICKKYQLFTLMELGVYKTEHLSALCSSSSALEKESFSLETQQSKQVEETTEKIPSIVPPPLIVPIPSLSTAQKTSIPSTTMSAKPKKKPPPLPTKSTSMAEASTKPRKNEVDEIKEKIVFSDEEEMKIHSLRNRQLSNRESSNSVSSVPSSHHLPVLPVHPLAPVAPIPSTPVPIIPAHSHPNSLPVNETLSKEYHKQIIAALQQKKQARFTGNS